MASGCASVPMPSSTVPMFSNRPATSHRIQSDIERMRITSAMATAIAPIEIDACNHAQIATPATLASRKALSVCRETVSWVTSRICACTVTMNSSIAPRA